MSRNNDDKVLPSRSYSEDLQRTFALLSGDFNPMHVDPVAARRTLAGGCAVHGIHLTLAAMEALLTKFAAGNCSEHTIAGFKAQFLKPVLVGETVDFHLTKLTNESCLVTGRIAGDNVCRISVQFGTILSQPEASLPPVPEEPVTELAFAELAGKSGWLALGIDVALAKQLFPLTTAMIGIRRMAAILALSRLVGMDCPGLHSIFAEATVRLTGTDDTGVLHYRVTETDERYSRAGMEVHGASLQGNLVAFFRPPPQVQPGMAEVANIVKPGSFVGKVALIVGGSRGLGEVTARIIAAGGGLPIITYYQGSTDAERVAENIRSNGGRCEVLPLDVRNADTLSRRMTSEQYTPRSIYYFATPKIFGRRHGFFDHNLLHEFVEIYVTAFGRLIDKAASTSPAKLRVFYPSSIAVIEDLRELIEYAMAKRWGEELCSFYNQHSTQLEIIVERLPRTKTDQTNTLLSVPSEDSLKVMLPIVQRMENVN